MVSGAVYGPGSDYGYSFGGYDGGSNSSIDRITFPFDSGISAHVRNMSGLRYHSAGCNSSNYGYSLGGYDSGSHSQIDRITFPFDSGTVTHVGTLSHSSHAGSSSDGTDFITLFDNLSSRVYV